MRLVCLFMSGRHVGAAFTTSASHNQRHKLGELVGQYNAVGGHCYLSVLEEFIKVEDMKGNFVKTEPQVLAFYEGGGAMEYEQLIQIVQEAIHEREHGTLHVPSEG